MLTCAPVPVIVYVYFWVSLPKIPSYYFFFFHCVSNLLNQIFIYVFIYFSNGNWSWHIRIAKTYFFMHIEHLFAIISDIMKRWYFQELRLHEKALRVSCRLNISEPRTATHFHRLFLPFVTSSRCFSSLLFFLSPMSSVSDAVCDGEHIILNSEYVDQSKVSEP